MFSAFTLSVANYRGKKNNTDYPNIKQVSNIQELADALKFDHVGALLRNNYRNNDNVIKANVIFMDIDNDDDNPSTWVTPEKVCDMLPGIEFFTCYSRNHMKDKTATKTKPAKCARPRFHIYIPLKRALIGDAEIRRYKLILLRIIPDFDSGAADASRFFFGVANPEILHFDGDADILEFLDNLPVNEAQIDIFSDEKKSTKKAEFIPMSEPVIPVSTRNNTLYRRGIHHIVFCESVDDARRAFDREVKKCAIKLSVSEVNGIWDNVLHSKAKQLADMARALQDKSQFLKIAKTVCHEDNIIRMVTRAVFENSALDREIAKAQKDNETAEKEKLVTKFIQNFAYMEYNEAVDEIEKDLQACPIEIKKEWFEPVMKFLTTDQSQEIIKLAQSTPDREAFIAAAKTKNAKEKFIDVVANALCDNSPREQMSADDALVKLAQMCLINNKFLNQAKTAYAQATENTGLTESSRAWEIALQSPPVKLAQIARQMKGEATAYLALAKTITDDNKLIQDTWELIYPNKKSGSFQRVEKKQVNINVVYKALQDLGVTVRLNVINQEVEYIGMPKNEQYVLQGFEKLSHKQRERALKKHMTGILLPYLRDMGYIVTSADIDGYLSNIAESTPYNPVAEMILSQKWDGVDRIRKLQEYMHIQNNEYYCMLVKKWLHQTVAMAFNDDGDYVNAFILLLYGKQGVGKTTVPHCLAFKRYGYWFIDGVDLDMTKKEECVKAQTRWIVEIGEFDQTAKHEQSTLKSFITTGMTSYRLWYGREITEQPRRTSYIATVNREKFLKDIAGGSRRYGIIHVTKIDYEILRALPEDWFIQLWAQVYQLYLAKPDGYMLTTEEKAIQELHNQRFAAFQRFEVDIIEHLDWEADISEWRYLSASAFLKRAELDKKISANDTRDALDRLAEQDKRIKIKTKTNQGKAYYLPPILDLNKAVFDEIELNEDTDAPPEAPQICIPDVVDPPAPAFKTEQEQQQPAANLDKIIYDWNEHNPHNVATENVIKIAQSLTSHEVTFEWLYKKVTWNEAKAVKFILNRLGRYKDAEIAEQVEDRKRQQIR